MNTKTIEWVLRIAVAGEFIGHGMFAVQAKSSWFGYFEPFGLTDPGTITSMLMVVGIVDLLLGVLVLIKPIRPAILWMAVWGLFTALIRWPIGPEPIWDFVERWTNWGAPLALYLLLGGRLPFNKN